MKSDEIESGVFVGCLSNLSCCAMRAKFACRVLIEAQADQPTAIRSPSRDGSRGCIVISTVPPSPIYMLLTVLFLVHPQALFCVLDALLCTVGLCGCP